MPNSGEIKKVWHYRKDRPKGSYSAYVWHACVDCGKERWVQLRRGEPVSLRCGSCAQKGERGHKWGGGRAISGRGYIYIKLSPDDFFYPMANCRGYVFEHRLVVAKALSRNLHPWELVHHKGAQYPKGSKEDKQDNRYPENLQLVTDDRHNQITVLENRIKYLEKRVTLLEAENVTLKREVSLFE